jgi:hypothetical protein
MEFCNTCNCYHGSEATCVDALKSRNALLGRVIRSLRLSLIAVLVSNGISTNESNKAVDLIQEESR